MDKRLNKDWTGSVRDRLEKRELKPSDALWERIGEALPPAAAPHRVRQLPWGGVAGAAAAAVAAVLLLRPSGAPEPGRVDVVPAAAPAQVAMVEKAEDHSGPASDSRPEPAVRHSDLTPDRHSERNEGSVTEENRSFATLRKTEEAPWTTGEVKPVTAEEPRAAEERPARTEEQNAAGIAKQVKAGTNQATAGTARVAAKDETATMSLEEYIEMEQSAKRRHRSLTAAVYATGVPSNSGLSNSFQNRLSELVATDKQSYSDYTPSTALPDAIGGTIANSVGGNDGNSGYTSNPESQNGFEPVKYAEDPYNINGTRMNHSRPVGAGLALTIPLGDRLFAESGVYWSWLRSTSAMVSDQSLHSVGVPIKLGYDFGGPGRISFSISAGGKAEKVFYAVRGGTRYKEPDVQFAAVGNAAVRFDITRNLGIFLAPELSYWFTRTQLPTYNTENPLNLSLKAGLNLTLGK